MRVPVPCEEMNIIWEYAGEKSICAKHNVMFTANQTVTSDLQEDGCWVTYEILCNVLDYSFIIIT